MTVLHDFGGVGTAFGHFSFGLSQFHGHGSWLVCEVALKLYVAHVCVCEACVFKTLNTYVHDVVFLTSVCIVREAGGDKV